MTNDDQVVMWNDVVGGAWVDHASHYDAHLEPFGRAAMDRLALSSGDRVLDVGCGTGATTLEIAGRVAPGTVVGVDLSATMLDAARTRAADAAAADTVEFRQVDVQTGDLGHGAFDAAFSRMGVMFFSDPVAAFANIAEALRPEGMLAFACFQGLSTNPIFLLPVLAVAEILDLPPLDDPSGPSPFSLADPDHVTTMLQAAGFVDVDIADGPDHFEIPDAGDLQAVAERMLVQNPIMNPRFTAADATTRAAALDATAEVLEPYRTGDVVRIGAGSWIVAARTPA